MKVSKPRSTAQSLRASTQVGTSPVNPELRVDPIEPTTL